jgi:hypothetical protein
MSRAERQFVQWPGRVGKPVLREPQGWKTRPTVLENGPGGHSPSSDNVSYVRSPERESPGKTGVSHKPPRPTPLCAPAYAHEPPPVRTPADCGRRGLGAGVGTHRLGIGSTVRSSRVLSVKAAAGATPPKRPQQGGRQQGPCFVANRSWPTSTSLRGRRRIIFALGVSAR